MTNGRVQDSRSWWATPRTIAIAVILVLVIALLAFRSKRDGGGGGGGANAKGVAAGGKAGGAAGGGGAPAMPPMPVDIDTARVQPIVDAVRATGHIEAVQAVELRPDEQGRVTALLFHEGQLVTRGAPLVRIDDEVLRAEAERADADRDLAKQQLDRVRRLREQNAATPADVERVEAAARSANANLAVLQLQIEKSTVRAPFSGVVGQRFISVGDYVTTGTRLLTLQTVDPQRAVIEVPERHAVSLKLGQTVDFTVAADPTKTFAARVDFIDPVVEATNRTITVKGLAPNPARVLRPGMFIEARLATATRANAIVIPEDAVQPLRTANVVWVVANGRASRRVVQLGARSQGIVEVTSGVSPGELVVVGGLERMGEGMPLMGMPRSAKPANQGAVK
jgi:membrane fusion protein (multidrug efflux system)